MDDASRPSRGKRLQRAATRDRSITSSITGGGAKVEGRGSSDHRREQLDAVDDGPLAGSEAPPAVDQPSMLDPPASFTADQQDEYVQMLARGASPSAACLRLGISVAALNRAIEGDEAFRAQLAGVRVMLSQNVAAALYRSAMEGNVTAMTFWLKASPPPGWNADDSPSQQFHTFDDTLDRLSDSDLAQLARSVGVDVPDEGAGPPDAPGGEPLAE